MFNKRVHLLVKRILMLLIFFQLTYWSRRKVLGVLEWDRTHCNIF